MSLGLGRKAPADWLVVSDLDGCLLDAETYAHDEARPALARLAGHGWPLVLCSGKTRAEMAPLAGGLGLTQPLIVENGGGIVFPPGSFDGHVPGARELEVGCVLDLGPPRERLVRALGEIAREAGARVRGFADLTPVELQAMTGLSEAATRLALQREYDEPFLLEEERASGALARAARSRGLVVIHGGRFHHLMGGTDKGLAVRTLLALYERVGRVYSAVGLGDAETDLSMLQAVSRPIVVPHPDGRVDPALAAELPEAERAPHPGPAGWNAAILAVLDGRTLPRLREAAAGVLR